VGLSIAPNGPQDQSTIDASDNAALLELFANSFVKGESRDESAEEKVQCSDKYENLQRRMLMRERPLATTVRTYMSPPIVFTLVQKSKDPMESLSWVRQQRSGG
jgi:hypothetical protein